MKIFTLRNFLILVAVCYLVYIILMSLGFIKWFILIAIGWFIASTLKKKTKKY